METVCKRELIAGLKQRGVRTTRQRIGLLELLFDGDCRHVSAEQLYQEAHEAGIVASLATIYNTLHQFTAAGIIRKVAVNTGQAFFDTNTSDHDHFYDQDGDKVIDIEDSKIEISKYPEPPPGYEIVGIEAIVRLRAIRK
ncbi:MAG: iron response transcriptional regulator IrrA [Pseudomonadota bacterium]